MNAVQEKIYRQLVVEIVEGRLALNAKLPPERELAERLGATRMNVHHAVKQLERRGLVACDRKRGTWVAREVPPELARRLKGETARKITALGNNSAFAFLHWNERFLSGLEPELAKAGYELDCRAPEGLDMERLAKEGARAFILHVRSDAELPPERQETLFRFHHKVFIYQSGAADWSRWPFHTVSINIFGEGCLAAEHLVGKGFRQIAYCSPSLPAAWCLERLQGLRLGMARHTEDICQPEVWCGPPADIHAQFAAAGGRHALVASNDEVAAAIIDHFAATGLEAGEDYHILGFDDNVKFRDYQLTTIAPRHQEIGRRLARLIIENIDLSTDSGCTSYIKVDSQVVARKTA